MGTMGTVSESLRPLYFKAMHVNRGWTIASVVFNGLLSVLTEFDRHLPIIAGRIWWISREARSYMGKQVDTRYKTIVAAMCV
ncbi:hypothetical protein PM082_024773 [Marasmius tenuissimus]|nr:hypothetical protein PM082_024773 [Marasmius tenuissimus]